MFLCLIIQSHLVHNSHVSGTPNLTFTVHHQFCCSDIWVERIPGPIREDRFPRLASQGIVPYRDAQLSAPEFSFRG